MHVIGPPDGSEIEALAPEVARKLKKQRRDIKYLREHFGLANDETIDGTSLEDQVAKLIDIWTKQSSSNDRERLKTLLCNANMSTLPFDKFFKKRL